MPTKKQRRRQQKSRRHEYEYVYVDDEGNEVAVDPAELRAEKPKDGPRQAPATKGNNRQASSTTTRRRAIEPPSWRRSAKRALVLGPLLVVAMMFFNRNLSLAEQIAPALFLIAFFIPFSYFTDSLAYRMYKKRAERRGAAKTR
jgi:hypothetical protein